MKRLLSILIIFSLLLPLFPSNALALGDAVKISTNSTTDAIYPQTITDSVGYLHTVWMEFDQASPSTTSGIYYSRWNGDTWSTPIKISENTAWAEIPTIAVDPNDTLHVVWADDTYGSDGLPRVAYRTRDFAGTWSTIESLPLPAGSLYARLPSVAIDSLGNPNVVFHDVAENFSDTSIYWTSKVTGNWGAPVLVSTNALDSTLKSSQWTDLASDLSGNLHLIYWDSSQGVFYRKYTGSWSTPVSLATGNLEFPRLAVTPSGEAFVAWADVNTTSVNVRWTQSSVWQAETTLSTSVSRPYFSSGIIGVTTDSSNRAHVGWGERDAGNLTDIRYRSFVPGSGWQAVQDVDLDNGDAIQPFVYPDLWDNQHFAWSEVNQTSGKWDVMYRVAEGTIQTLSTTGGTITANPFGTTQATLSVPNGALSASTQIGLQVGPVPESVNPNVVTIPKAYTLRPHGTIFNSPVTLRVFYTAAEVVGADEALLQPWLWDSQTSSWTSQTVTRRSTAQNWMEVELNHFSLYGISAPKVIVEWEKPKNNIAKGKKIDFSFTMNYADGKPVVEPANPDELKVILKDSSDNTLQTLKYDKKQVKKQGKDKYSGTFQVAKELSGNVTMEVHLRDGLMSSHQIELK